MRGIGCGSLRIWTLGLVLLLTLAIGQSLELGAAGQPWEGDPFSGDPKAMLVAARSLVKDGSEETVILLDERRIVLDATSRAVETHRVVYRIGKSDPEEWSNIEAAWRPWRQERPAIRARVITTDGRQVELDRKILAEAPLGETGSDTFGDARVLRAPLPAVASGVVVETQSIVRDRSPLFERAVSAYLSVGSSVPTLQTLIVVEAPTSLPFKHAARLLPDLKTSRSTSGNKTTTTFQVGPLDALDPIDVLLESPDDPIRPYVAFSTAASWSDVASSYSRVVETQIGQSNVAALVKEVTGSASARSEIVERLMQHVQKKIRYKAVQLGEAALVPTPPNETLRLEYGDCKDQAALLVSMLRAAGIEAHIALLSVSAFDAHSELPGFGAFDHAIVYVPGEAPVWIDSTSRFSRLGQLPGQDQSRMALIIKPDAKTLVRVPEFKARTVETREVLLSELGPGRIIETTEYFGSNELEERAHLSETKDEELRENLEQYVQGAYAAKSVGAIRHTDPFDLTVPLRLTLEAIGAEIADTGLGESAVAINLAPLIDEIAFLADSETEDGTRGKGNTRDVVVNDASKEWRYRVVPPAGFAKNEVPANKTERLGPATLAWEFSTASDGAVAGVLRFDTGKRKYSAQEANEVTAALKKLEERLILLVTFEQVGEAHLSAGRVREALVEFRKLAGLHPAEALHRAQIARALLGGGLGEAARAEARRAVELEPNSVVAYQILGITMEHDLAGGRFKRGWDRTAAMAAYRKAVQLDPENVVNLVDLGVLLEHNADGQRYGAGADLDQAIEQYRTAISKSEAGDQRNALQDNLSVALLWSGRFKEVRETAVRAEIRLAATAALDGVNTAVAEAGRSFPDAGQRQAALIQAGSILLQVRMYPLAAEMLRSAARGASNASEILSRAELVGRIKRYEEINLPSSDPRSVVTRAMTYGLLGEAGSELGTLVMKENQDSLNNRDGIRTVAQNLLAFAGGSNAATAVSRDMLASTIEMTAEGDDKIGYRVTFRPAGSNSSGGRLFVMREEEQYRLLTLDRTAAALAIQAIRLSDAGDSINAKRLLDWARDEIRPNASDAQQIAGSTFFSAWLALPYEQQIDPQILRSAAATLISTSPKDAALALTILNAARARASEAREKDTFDLAYAGALLTAGRYEESLRLGTELTTGTQGAGARLVVFNSLVKLGRFNEAKERLKKGPEPPPNTVSIEVRAILGDSVDIQMNRRLAAVESMQGNFAAAEALLRQIVGTNSAQAGDYNNLAWLGLFRDKPTEEDISTALRAVSLGQNRNSTTLHTLAALYAENGRTPEALQVIQQAMAADGNRAVESSDWYVFGRIYEQLGELDAAVNAFRKVQQPTDATVDPTTPYAMAQRRLTALAKQ